MTSNFVKDSLNEPSSTVCALCGLMCDLGDANTGRCTRLNRWMTQASRASASALSSAGERISRVKPNARTLIWLDACDVQTTRAAVHLARQTGATIHVGQSTGSHAVKSVMASSGWLGTSLSEVAARADLIITLGDGILSEAPLLSQRFFRSSTRSTQPRWVHISQRPSGNQATLEHNDDGFSAVPARVINWPREQWFEQLSRLAISLMQPQAETCDAGGPTISQLSAELQAVKQSVWLWDVDEMHFHADELIVRRISSIAEILNERLRCALLPLDLNVGRVTAEETVLWLTGCPTTATWNGSGWSRSLRYSGYSLEQWAAEFSSVILVSSLASDRSMPNLTASLVIQTSPASHEREVQVAAVGRDCSGHLFRGDRGTVFFSKATSSSELPTAVEVLKQLTENAVAN